MIKKFNLFFLTFFMIGKIKYAPGTIASLITCILFLLLINIFDIIIIVIITLIIREKKRNYGLYTWFVIQATLSIYNNHIVFSILVLRHDIYQPTLWHVSHDPIFPFCFPLVGLKSLQIFHR